VARWPVARITLRQGIRVLNEVEDLHPELRTANRNRAEGMIA
jgi:hypothetical protein